MITAKIPLIRVITITGTNGGVEVDARGEISVAVVLGPVAGVVRGADLLRAVAGTAWAWWMRQMWRMDVAHAPQKRK